MKLGYKVRDFRCTKFWLPKGQTFVPLYGNARLLKFCAPGIGLCRASAAGTDTLIVKAPVSFQEAAENPFSLCGQSKC